jgi:hypothetical protein
MPLQVAGHDSLFPGSRGWQGFQEADTFTSHSSKSAPTGEGRPEDVDPSRAATEAPESRMPNVASMAFLGQERVDLMLR